MSTNFNPSVNDAVEMLNKTYFALTGKSCIPEPDKTVAIGQLFDDKANQTLQMST